MQHFILTRVLLILLASTAMACAQADADADDANAQPARQRGYCLNVKPVSPFDLNSYVSAEWYVLEQKTTWYQPERDLFCVRANYTLVDDDEIEVWNTAVRDGVNGTPRNAKGYMKLRGIVEDPSNPAKLLVGPKFLPKRLYGPYWVVATDTTPGTPEFEARGYSWAIISGGPLTKLKSDGSCEPSGGLWLFHRNPLADAGEIRSAAQSLGIDTSVLKKVQQEGCTYPR